MKTLRRSTIVWLGSLLLVAAPAAAGAQESRPGRANPEDHFRDGLLSRLMHLMPPACAAELNLTADQRKQVAAVEDQFKQKRRAVLLKTVLAVVAIVDSLEGKEGSREPAPALAIAHEITGGMLEMRRSRVSFEDKMLAVLDADQKDQYREFKASRRADREHGRAHRHHRGESTSELFSPEGQTQLRLTAEQKTKLSEARREYESRLRTILTAEQLQQYERMAGRDRSVEARPVGRRERPKDDEK